MVKLIFLIYICTARTALNCVIDGKTTTLWANKDFFNFSDIQDIETEIRNVKKTTYGKMTLEQTNTKSIKVRREEKS